MLEAIWVPGSALKPIEMQAMPEAEGAPIRSE
jgi:hypothetical protein